MKSQSSLNSVTTSFRLHKRGYSQGRGSWVGYRFIANTSLDLSPSNITLTNIPKHHLVRATAPVVTLAPLSYNLTKLEEEYK